MDWSAYAVGGAASRDDSFTGLNPQFSSGLYQMVRDAHAAGIPLQITSAYRSPELQGELYQAALEKYGDEATARRWVAPPGRSQHNYGTAADFAINGQLIRDANSPAAQWIRENAARYGLAVPMDWEPWQVELAGARGQAPSGQPTPEAPQTAPQPAQERQEALNRLAMVQDYLPRTNALNAADFQTQQQPANALYGFGAGNNPFVRG